VRRPLRPDFSASFIAVQGDLEALHCAAKAITDATFGEARGAATHSLLKRSAPCSDIPVMTLAPSDTPMQRRKQPRFKTRFDALYSGCKTEGAGVLADISYSGARIENASLRPEVGTCVRLYVFIQPVLPFELIGHVVRITEDGFAIEYDVSDPDVRHLVDDVAAIVTAPQA
jgi:hypothetical protein